MTISEWVPQGDGSCSIKPFRTATVTASGSFGVYVDAVALSDLFWPEEPSFKL